MICHIFYKRDNVFYVLEEETQFLLFDRNTFVLSFRVQKLTEIVEKKERN